MNVLSEIVAKKHEEIEAAKAARPLETLQKEAASFRQEKRPFRELFEKGPVLIAEVKPKSPSAGHLTSSPLEIADLYTKGGVDAVSVLTDEKYFGGSLELLKEVRERVPQAILRKDFIVDEYQVYESLLAGADAFLLIANILRTEKLLALTAVGQALNLDMVVEIHDEEDLKKALGVDAMIIGINNRDLKTLKIDIETTQRLAQKLPTGSMAISESGIETAADVRRVRGWGMRGILVGTSILQSADPVEKIKELKQALI